MRILIVGGTVFLGRALTGAALARGHDVTLLNRGKSVDRVPAGVAHVQADRNGDLMALQGRTWDAVIDTCAYFPRQVRSLLAALGGQAHYTLISSVSVYANLEQSGLDESAVLSAPLLDDAVTAVDGTTYGPLKSACEHAAGDTSLIIRPGIMVGPHDPTGRFGYWVRRLGGEGEFLAPGNGAVPLQIIDVRDLGEWIVRLVEQRTTGTFNAVGPRHPLIFRDFIGTGLVALHSAARPVWVSEEFLMAAGIEGWAKLPLWLPITEAKFTGLFAIDGRKAWAAGLVARPLTETIVDVSRYEASLEKPVPLGLRPDEERALLDRFEKG